MSSPAYFNLEQQEGTH